MKMHTNLYKYNQYIQTYTYMTTYLKNKCENLVACISCVKLLNTRHYK